MSNVQETSVEAYKSIKPLLGQRQQQVLDVFYEHPDVRDWTNLELARHLGFDPNQVTPRVLELRELGILKQSRVRTCRASPRHRNALAWTIREAHK